MKNKNILFAILILLCSVMFFSCAEKEINIDLSDLADVIGEKIDLSNTVPYSSDKIHDDYGIAPDDVVQIIVLKEMDVNSAEVLIFAEAVDEQKAKEIEENLKVYKTYKLNELSNYTANPDNENQYYIVDGAEMMVKQNYVFWAVNSENKEINDIINDYIKSSK